jgi:TPP-dependent trihydroxycyclohexane-1,2-dione (THcHDO) dehydratase
MSSSRNSTYGCPPSGYRLVNQGAGSREVAEAVALIRRPQPVLLVGHGVHTSRTQAGSGSSPN